MLSSKELRERARRARDGLLDCELCPRRCGVNRLAGEKGFCHAGAVAKVASHNVHLGEEPPLSGSRGSGTIFFSYCTLHCVYCQNYPISQLGEGNEVTAEELAGMMLRLEQKGCHNINLVTPTHYIPQILEALALAVEQEFNLPIVYNTSGYELPETLKLMEGAVDIYLPDMRYADSAPARLYSGAADYPEINRAAVKEMYGQVGDLLLDEEGIARRGLIIRHLVLPGNLAGTERTMEFIAEEISPDTYISLMSQYFPAYKAVGNPLLDRRITTAEYAAAQDIMETYGLTNGWIQEY
jgi:putative pyruvate formate lyase activating enzyme